MIIVGKVSKNGSFPLEGGRLGWGWQINKFFAIYFIILENKL